MQNSYVFFAIMMMLTGCSLQAGGPMRGEEWTVCHDPRPQICTMEYVPVCGQDQAGKLRTYASGCTACADSKVTRYRSGSCEQAEI